jgi:ppGpp synthetase/RelA/SpoT-type nucleotidyltranferase
MEITESSESNFDFDTHRITAREGYQKIKPSYEQFSEVIKRVIKDALKSLNINVASIEARAKSVESFEVKAVERSLSDPNQPKYKDPLKEITDLAGIRIITFYPRTIEDVDNVIKSEFDVLEKSDKTDTLMQQEKFGYQSVHYLISLKSNRTSLPEYRQFIGFTAEVQVRTILQHAWAEIEHDIQYKSIEITPISISRRFMSLAGLLELADREFQAIQVEDERLMQVARESVQEGKLEIVEITPNALKTYLDKKMGSDGRMAAFSYGWMARNLRKLGFTNFRQIDECISGYDDARLNKILWGTLQGQLTRFEYLLLAGMGENFIKGHYWSNLDWFVTNQHDYLVKFEKAGIKIGTYQPLKDDSGKPA